MPRLMLVAFVCLAVPTARADWPLFRGNPLQTGVSTEKLPEKLEIRWQIKLKDGIEATAALTKDTVYVGSFDGHLYAFDLATGQEKWKYKAGPFKAPASVKDGAVYIGDEDGMFHCVDAATGIKRWQFETNGEITGGANFAKDRVLFGSHDSTLYCLSDKGKELWKYKIQGPVNGSALVAGEQTFVAGCDSQLHVIDIKSGKGLAQIELSGQAAATAAFKDGQLYVGNMANELQAIDLAKKAVAWSFEPKRSQPFYGSAAVTDKLVIAGSRDRNVYALDRVKGEPVWTAATKGRVDSSPVVVGTKVYVGSTDGNLYVLDLAKGHEVQTLELGRGVTASPAVADGCVVIGTTDGILYCLGAKK